MCRPYPFFLLLITAAATAAPVTVFPLEAEDVVTTAAATQQHEAHVTLRESLIDAGTGYGGSQLFMCARCPVVVHGDDDKRYRLRALELDDDDALHMLFCGGSAVSPCDSNLTLHHEDVRIATKDDLAAHVMSRVVQNSEPNAPWLDI